MSDHPEVVHIQRCVLLIEKMLGWGSSNHWTQHDFEKLSEAIEEKTSVRLSVTTLKRIWGKVKYENAPTTATLNALARFAGLEDWRTFVSEQGKEQVSIATPKPKSSWRKWLYGAGAGALGVFAVYFMQGNTEPKSKPDPNDFSFTANKVVSEGVPNSVIFSYDASAAKTDSIFIVQSWDLRRKMLVSKEGKSHSSIYYYPGYFKAKLIIGNEIVKTYDLQITSDGWLGMVENGDKPFYFTKKQIARPGHIEIDEALLAQNNFTMSPTVPQVLLSNQRDLGDLMNDNFTFETTLKNVYKGGSNPCQFVEVLIQCKDDVIVLPLSAKTCVGELGLYAAGKQMMSKTEDLSGLGADLSEWTTLKVICKNKDMEVFVNGKKAIALTIPNKPAGIVGVQYRFNGVGAVKDTWFENDSGKRVL